MRITKINWLVVSVLIGLTGCDHPAGLEQGAVQSAAASQASSAPASIAAVQTETGPDASLASASVVPQPSDAQFDKWKTEMASACGTVTSAVKTKHFDVNGDGLPDTICWRAIKTKDYGDFFDLQATVQTARAGTQTAYIILPVDPIDQLGVCGPTEALSATQVLWTRKGFEDMGWDYIGPMSIEISGSDCDPPWLFWPKAAKGKEVEFEFARL